MPPLPPGEGTPLRQRPGGRSENVRQAVARAVVSLMREGRLDFAVAEVAARAGVHRATIYRWWPHRVALVREALMLYTSQLRVPDTGSWPSDVQALAVALARYLSDPVVIGINAVMASGTDPEMTSLIVAHWTPLFTELAQIVERGRRRGEVSGTADAALLLEMLVSPLLVRTVLLRASLPPSFVHRLGRAVSQAGELGPR